MSPRRLLPLVLISAAAAAGCAGAQASSSSRPLVVATTTQLGDIVRQVAGGRAVVHQILQPNTDPHEYEPRPGDVKATAGAALVVESGNGLDAWMAKVVEEAGADPAVLSIAPAHTPERIPGERSGPEASRFDPHWWHDPRDVESAVRTVAAALAKVSPVNAGHYRADADAYLAKLRRLDRGIAGCMRQVPVARRKLVTSHDAFGYFARRYGVTVVGAVIPSQTTEAQPSAGELQRLAAQVRREHVSAVFPESSLNPKLSRALARETGARSDYVLYGDTLGPAGSRGATYLGMEAANADAMVRGFTGGARGCTIAGI
jgi:ABC-type Zn uptake system ZnuABC Zn-binding protein ZnuA